MPISKARAPGECGWAGPPNPASHLLGGEAQGSPAPPVPGLDSRQLRPDQLPAPNLASGEGTHKPSAAGWCPSLCHRLMTLWPLVAAGPSGQQKPGAQSGSEADPESSRHKEKSFFSLSFLWEETGGGWAPRFAV